MSISNLALAPAKDYADRLKNPKATSIMVSILFFYYLQLLLFILPGYYKQIAAFQLLFRLQ